MAGGGGQGAADAPLRSPISLAARAPLQGSLRTQATPATVSGTPSSRGDHCGRFAPTGPWRQCLFPEDSLALLCPPASAAAPNVFYQSINRLRLL